MKLYLKPFERMLYGQMTQNVEISLLDVIILEKAKIDEKYHEDCVVLMKKRWWWQ